MFTSKYSICNMENNTLEFKLYPVFKHSPNKKGKVYDPYGIQPQGKQGNSIIASMEYTLMVYRPTGKDMIL